MASGLNHGAIQHLNWAIDTCPDNICLKKNTKMELDLWVFVSPIQSCLGPGEAAEPKWLPLWEPQESPQEGDVHPLSLGKALAT